jgi:hypothetical protein
MLVDPLADAELNVPGPIETLVAPAVAQLSVVLVPASIVVGAAANDAIVGTDPFTGGVLDEFPDAHPPNPTLTSTTIVSQQTSTRAHLRPLCLRFLLVN